MEDFCRPDGKKFLSSSDRGHYCFAFSWDSFNPWGNKEAGEKAMVSAVYIVCLDLLPHLRYQSKNIFLVGIIPRPHELSVDQFHHFIEPLVDDLLALWDPGMKLDATPCYFNGQTIQVTLVALIADLLATCTAAGHAHHSSSFMCSFCQLHLQNITNL